jgi:hypothetical protein
LSWLLSLLLCVVLVVGNIIRIAPVRCIRISTWLTSIVLRVLCRIIGRRGGCTRWRWRGWSCGIRGPVVVVLPASIALSASTVAAEGISATSVRVASAAIRISSTIRMMTCIWPVAISVRFHSLRRRVRLEPFVLLSHIAQEVLAQFFGPLNFLRIGSGDMEIHGLI